MNKLELFLIKKDIDDARRGSDYVGFVKYIYSNGLQHKLTLEETALLFNISVTEVVFSFSCFLISADKADKYVRKNPKVVKMKISDIYHLGC